MSVPESGGPRLELHIDVRGMVYGASTIRLWAER